MVEPVAGKSNDNEAPGDKDLDSMGTYVKVAGLDIDLSQGFVEPVKGLFVREAFAGLVRQVEPGTEETIGKYVKPASPRSLASFDVAVYVRALGTSGQLTRSINYKGQRFVELYHYLRPTAKYAGAVMQAVALAKELTDRGVPWTALAIVYPTPGTRLRRPRVLHVKGIWAYYTRYHSLAGIRYYPEVRLYFTRHVLGLKKRTPYLFDLIILYSTKPLQKPPSRQELVEQAMAQTPPPRLVLAQAPQAQAPGKFAKVRAVEAQPEAPTAQAQAQQAKGKGRYVTEAQEARRYVTQVEAQPTAQPAQAQPAVEAQPEANNGPPKELEERYREVLEESGMSPEEIERALKKWREEWKKVTF
jgi:hypothetical protein